MPSPIAMPDHVVNVHVLVDRYKHVFDIDDAYDDLDWDHHNYFYYPTAAVRAVWDGFVRAIGRLPACGLDRDGESRLQ